MTTPCRARAFLAGLAFLAGAVAPLTPSTAYGEGLQRFTGYSNPGTPSDVVKPNGDIVSAADEPKAFGGSIYFMVLDRGEGRGNDSWGTHIKDFDQQFQTGVDDGLKPSPGLDKKARYLYLYQVINDRGSKSPIHEMTIRLVIDPALITSWGFFGAKGKDNKAIATGVGFAAEFDDKGKAVGVPMSTDHHMGPTKRAFVENALRITAPTPYGMNEIKVGNAPKAIADDAEGENTGRAPVAVVLLKSADFKGAPEIKTQGRMVNYDLDQGARGLPAENVPVAPAAFNGAFDYPRFAPFDMDLGAFGMGNVVGVGAPGPRPVIFAAPDADGRPDSSRSPAIRAVFYDVEGDIPVRQGERSLLFGFTSNFPPMFEAARLRGSEFVKAAGVADAVPAGAANLRVDADEVPTPVAFEQPSASATGIGTVTGSLGGETSVSSPGGSLGAGGVPGFSGLGGGISSGGGTPSNSGNGQQAQQQQQQQPTTVIIPQQQQQQQQQEDEETPPGNVVPEPASLASALLGVPFLFLFIRRKKAAMT